jgi:cyclophilin family peptidyl-prolyl cis-trans isomerase
MKQFAIAACLLTLAACSTGPAAKNEAPKKAEPAKPKLAPSTKGVPDVYKVRLDTTKGPVVIEVHREWAPLGAERFHELVKDGFYTQAAFFRVVKNYVAQFGLAANPAMTKKWDVPIDDDPVMRTNKLGAVSFATSGPNSRTSQVFINLRSNQTLDEDGFAPFGQVIEGMEAVERIYQAYGNQPNQEIIMKRGNAYLKENFPNLDYIRKAAILP